MRFLNSGLAPNFLFFISGHVASLGRKNNGSFDTEQNHRMVRNVDPGR